MSPKGRRAERKAARYWGPVVGKNSRQVDSDGGDGSDSRQLDDAATITSRVVIADGFSNNDAEMPPARQREVRGKIPMARMKENVQTDQQPISANRDAITHRNRKESILLQLPAEIRRQIWEMAFGYRTVHPRAMRGNTDWQTHRKWLKASKWGVSYDPCLQRLSDYGIYALSLQNPDADHWHEDMRPDLGAPGWHPCGHQTKPRKYHYLVPPVCKQLWIEGSACAWETVAFAFTTSGDFQHFVLFSGARLDQVRQICIISPGMDFFGGQEVSEKNKFERGWERALKSGVFQRFTSLVGLHLVLRSFWGTSRWGISTVENLEFPPDECLYLPEIIRVFQPLRLRPECITVLVTNDQPDEAYGYEEFTVPKRRRMAQLIREFILEETPSCDWTGPGQRMVIRP